MEADDRYDERAKRKDVGEKTCGARGARQRGRLLRRKLAKVRRTERAGLAGGQTERAQVPELRR